MRLTAGRKRPRDRWCHRLFVSVVGLSLLLVYVYGWFGVSFHRYLLHAVVTELKALGSTGNETVEADPEANVGSDLQIIAMKALEAMEANRIFDTAVTDHGVVVHKGFPMAWEPCTFQRILHSTGTGRGQPFKTKKKLPIEILILGGSFSSASAMNCQIEGDNLSGRYGNILQRALDRDTVQYGTANGNGNSTATGHSFHVVNMAQGNRDSSWFGYYLDSFVNVPQTDLIIWEFAVNDHGGLNPANANAEMRCKILDFFFRRIYHLFVVEHNRPPPPILLLYTWEHRLGVKPIHVVLGRNGVVAPPLRDAWRLIHQYRKELGWNIQVIDVGGTIDKHRFVGNRSLLLDDIHHSNCLGNHLMAHMIQHAIYTNIAVAANTNATTTTTTCNTATVDKDASAAFPELPPLTEFMTNAPSRVRLMFDSKDDNNKGIRWGSWTTWKPNRNASNLHVDKESAKLMEPLIQNIIPERILPTRADRKNSYSIPLCNLPSSQHLKLTLLEPHLQWVGLELSWADIDIEISLTTTDYHVLEKKAVRADRNGRKVTGMDWIYMWIDIRGLFRASSLSATDRFSFSFCKRKDQDRFLHGLVGIMQDPSSSSSTNNSNQG